MIHVLLYFLLTFLLAKVCFEACMELVCYVHLKRVKQVSTLLAAHFQTSCALIPQSSCQGVNFLMNLLPNLKGKENVQLTFPMGNWSPKTNRSSPSLNTQIYCYNTSFVL